MTMQRAKLSKTTAKVVKGQARCPQCWDWKTKNHFVGKRGGVTKNCNECRAKYRGWEGKTFDEKLASRPPRPVTGTGYRVSFTLKSGNRKLGGLPASMTDRASCPTTCSLRDHGCYAEFHTQRMHWDRVAKTGMSWASFCVNVAALPEGTLWRHNEAGDLPGVGNYLDAQALGEIVEANRGRRGFGFTHKHALGTGLSIREANENGFTINLSADSIEQADELADLRVGPVVVVLPHDAPDTGNVTPAGRRIVVCPYETRGLTCADCQLCAMPTRKSIIGFRAHGQYKKPVSEIVRSKRPAVVDGVAK